MTETAYDIHRLQPCTCGVGDTKQHVLKAVQRTASAESSSYENEHVIRVVLYRFTQQGLHSLCELHRHHPQLTIVPIWIH